MTDEIELKPCPFCGAMLRCSRASIKVCAPST